MTRASPVVLRQALEMANTFAKAGIDFVCVPVLNEADKIGLTNQAHFRIEELLDRAEAEEGV